MSDFLKKKFSKISLRVVIQLIILALVIGLAFLHQFYGIEKAAPIDAYCPFGALESFFTLIFKGEFLKRIFVSSFILLGIFTLATLVLGRVFCSYFCPLGALQEWLRILGKKLGFRKDLEFPQKLDKYFRLIKYILLVIIIYFSFYLGDLVFRIYDPYSSLMHFGTESEELFWGYVVLVVVLVLALVSKSIWCRYFCPLGAFFAIIKKISFFKIERDTKTCNSCNLCDINCPAHLKIKDSLSIKDADCISCGKCVSVCPKDSLSFKIFNKTVSKKLFSILVLALVILPLAIAPYTPFWQTKPQSNIISATGSINVEDIKGSNTLAYVIQTTKVPLSEFQKSLKLPLNIDSSLMLKEIGTKYNLNNSEGTLLETEDFRNVVRDYLARAQTSNQTCPFNETNCVFPGKCASYVDTNQDNICDYSQ